MARTIVKQIKMAAGKEPTMFRRIVNDSYQKLLNDFKEAAERGSYKLNWEYTQSASLNRKWNKKVCMELVEKAKEDGFYAKADFSTYEGFYEDWYIVISTKKIFPSPECSRAFKLFSVICFFIMLGLFILWISQKYSNGIH